VNLFDWGKIPDDAILSFDMLMELLVAISYLVQAWYTIYVRIHLLTVGYHLYVIGISGTVILPWHIPVEILQSVLQDNRWQINGFILHSIGCSHNFGN
jgi:hypothetical protein